jgi:hypothetical protein
MSFSCMFIDHRNNNTRSCSSPLFFTLKALKIAGYFSRDTIVLIKGL